MHLWPSMKIRDSFKHSYLKNVEWNLRRMNSEKQAKKSNQENLLDKKVGDDDGEVSETLSSRFLSGTVGCYRETLMLFCSFYCCFCCDYGDYADEEEI